MPRRKRLGSSLLAAPAPRRGPRRRSPRRSIAFATSPSASGSARSPTTSSRTWTARSPTRVSIFVAAPDKLEVAKVEKGVNDAAWVRARFDWHALHGRPHRRRRHQTRRHGRGAREPSTSTGKPASCTSRSAAGRAAPPWRQLPFHVYNFDFTSLNFAWRHLADPKAPVRRSASSTRPSRRRATSSSTAAIAKIEYVGEEKLHGKTLPEVPDLGPRHRRHDRLDLGGPEGRLAREDRDPVPGQPRLEQLQARARGDRDDDAGRLEEVHRRLAREGEREELAGPAGDELLLPPDRLGADRGELGVLADRVEERVVVHRRMAEVVSLDGLAEEAQRSPRDSR